MKKALFIFSLLLMMTSCNSQGKRPLMGDTDYQKELNASFKDASKSPLKKKDLRKFNGLEFFTVDSTFIVKATFTEIKNAPTFEMATTTDRKPLYKKYVDYLFLPFTDDTSGNESYGGGRYMDVMTTDITEKNTVLLNFNNTYNPYCAYNDKYSCPLTPRKNHLDVEIKAGIKVFEKH